MTFTICSAVSFLFSISFYVFAEFFTKITFPQAEGYAIELGNAMRYVLAASIFLASSMLFHLRNLTGESNQKSVFFGTSLGEESMWGNGRMGYLGMEQIMIKTERYIGRS